MKNFPFGQRSPAASNDESCEHGELVQVQDVDALVPCWILQLWFEQHTTGSQIALAFAAASCCGFSEVHLRLCPDCPWFLTCGCFLACTYDSLRLYSTYLHNLRIFSSVLFRNDASRLGVLYLLICHCKPLKRIITCAIVLSADKLMQNYSTCAEGLSFCTVFFSLFALRRLVDDYDRSGAYSTTLLCVHLFPNLF